jgi:glycosyltransferase involved in cell wall biosynthesis
MFSNDQVKPRVSIGVPTYKRPDSLRRTLRSIATQQFSSIEVIVGDNDAASTDSETVVEEFRNAIPHLTYRRHEHNIGGPANFMYCLDAAKGEYFMWLADDDEIFGDHYIAALVSMLDQHPDAATAAAKWKLLRSPQEGSIQKPRAYTNEYWLWRAFKYAWKADDDFFYGLHRIQLLRNATLPDYWPVNAHVSSNLTYTYLIDMVLQGKILRLTDDNCLWINHAYTLKDHTKESSGRSVNLGYVLRRLNVHWLYMLKVHRRGGLWAAACLFPVSVASLFAEALRIGQTYVAFRMARLESN